jgi:hypothetical protein
LQDLFFYADKPLKNCWCAYEAHKSGQNVQISMHTDVKIQEIFGTGLNLTKVHFNNSLQRKFSIWELSGIKISWNSKNTWKNICNDAMDIQKSIY